MTTIFLVITIIVSALAFRDRNLMGKLIFNPYLIHTQKQWYRFFSSGLIHADIPHLAINMLVFYSFGRVVENDFINTFGFDRGNFYYAILYISSLFVSIIPTYNKNKMNPGYNGLGASGAVSAVVFAMILFDPMSRIALYGIIKLPSILYGVLYLFYCYYMERRAADNINHSAHMWGAIYGFTFPFLIKYPLLPDFFEKLIYFRNAI